MGVGGGVFSCYKTNQLKYRKLGIFLTAVMILTSNGRGDEILFRGEIIQGQMELKMEIGADDNGRLPNLEVYPM